MVPGASVHRPEHPAPRPQSQRASGSQSASVSGPNGHRPKGSAPQEPNGPGPKGPRAQVQMLPSPRPQKRMGLRPRILQAMTSPWVYLFTFHIRRCRWWQRPPDFEFHMTCQSNSWAGDPRRTPSHRDTTVCGPGTNANCEAACRTPILLIT